ncbi:MAG TPA: hypothetical protein PKM57_03540 [Kiritimatiellia bacterium]|nr:hypothetical protein [Kiritimatiellia bacterium]HPS06326.1 hypothetical protein [Kiritimatiellia bacterium]
MKQMVGVMGALAGLLVGFAQAETVSLVQTTDMRGQSEYSVLTREEYAALQKEIKEEAAVYAVAAAEAKKEWESDKENKLPFQGNRIKVRTAKKMGADFTDRDKAEKKKTQIEERASEKQLAEMDKAEKKAKQSKPKEEDVAKEEARTKAFEDAFAMISKKMGDKLGRPVPSIGFAMEAPKEEPKKEEPKKDEKKDEKKNEKKAGH